MLTKNDLQQIREVVREEVKVELKPVKRKLNVVEKDLHYIIGKFDTRIVENQREIQKIKAHVGMSQ